MQECKNPDLQLDTVIVSQDFNEGSVPLQETGSTAGYGTCYEDFYKVSGPFQECKKPDQRPDMELVFNIFNR